MTIEDVLLDLGDRPLSRCDYSRDIVTVVNARLRTEAPVVPTMTGGEILSKIFDAPETTQKSILNHQLGRIKSRDSYRTSVLVCLGIIAVIAITLAISALMGGSGDSGANSTSLLSQIITGIFDLLRAMIDGGNDAPSN